MTTTAERIKQLRKKAGLSQAELASRIGVKSNTVSTWERGTRKPDFEALSRLADLFDVSFEYILCESDDSTRPQMHTDAEMNELAESMLVDEVYNTVKMYCRLGTKSQELVKKLIEAAYAADKSDGELNPEDPFEITIAPKRQ